MLTVLKMQQIDGSWQAVNELKTLLGVSEDQLNEFKNKIGQVSINGEVLDIIILTALVI